MILRRFVTMNARYYEVSLSLVKQAGDVIRKGLAKKKNIEIKSCDVDLVTETDREVEKLLIDGLHNAFPDHKFIGEESVAGGAACVLTDSPTWIIDPVDGTMNFVHNFPHVCISIALLINKIAEVAIIYNPILDQLFTAQKNQGSYLNDKIIKVSNENQLKNSLLMVEAGTSKDPEKMKIVIQNMEKLTLQIHGIRTLGSAALNMAMVAMGAADANFEFGIHAWDIAAGALIVQEAGGVVMDPSGSPLDLMSRRVLCASSKELAMKLCEQLIQYYPKPRD